MQKLEKTLTHAENKAVEATSLEAFPINLHHIRNTIKDILNQWKSSGFFAEYTDHSFLHVTDLIETAEWIIPQSTKLVLTHGDWLMIVLSCYFHDVGLIITKEEYKYRYSDSDFKRFLDNPVLPADKHAQYLARLSLLSEDDAERLKYEEFVRFSHGKRVRSWLEGKSLVTDELSPMRKIIEGLLSPLSTPVRRDLALLCESHTLSAIDNTSVYKTSQPYGNNDETVNLQYCAAILRTADLLQITRKRAPAVLYQLINPGDPVSQREWQKQTAVRAVRQAVGRDREGHVDSNAVADTIEVHATFTEPDGFFGLTSYLAYAQKELTQTHVAIQKSAKNVLKNYSFPWRSIDTSGIDTQGFLTQSFEFELDQHKILDLLTGHTLYNDATVVLRELTQNALDAVRLQAVIENAPSEIGGQLDIAWDTNQRTLTVTDNGTGMTQEVIENHLLKVGSSRYQDTKFKDKHPEFHSISRFGIGVLSAFMVSDDVEITTCSEEEETARRIALRSVHGKYLIKLLDKIADRGVLPMYPHGTSVKMKLRPNAEIGNILQIARSWLLFPRCRVRVIIDNAPAISVGFGSPSEAIQSYIDTHAPQWSRRKREYAVKEFTEDGITLAFAIVKDNLFQDWSFADAPRPRGIFDEEDGSPPIGTCIEGVAVETDTPGFRGRKFIAIANAVGPNAPKTNVARSALEDTSEQRDMLEVIYRLYSRHITDEIHRLSSSDSHSLSRAVSVAPWIALPLMTNGVQKPILLSEAMAQIPLVLVEDGENRENISFTDLSKESEFWTIESPLHRSVEYFVKEAPGDVTANRILATLGNVVGSGNPGKRLCNVDSRYVDENVKSNFEIVQVIATEGRRQLDIKWQRKAHGDSWISSNDVYNKLAHDDPKFWRGLQEARERLRQGPFQSEGIFVPKAKIETIGLEDATCFVINREKYLKWGVPLCDYFLELTKLNSEEGLRSFASAFVVLELMRNWEIIAPETIERTIQQHNLEIIKPYLYDVDVFASSARSTGNTTFDPFAWDRRSTSDHFFY